MSVARKTLKAVMSHKGSGEPHFTVRMAAVRAVVYWTVCCVQNVVFTVINFRQNDVRAKQTELQMTVFKVCLTYQGLVSEVSHETHLLCV